MRKLRRGMSPRLEGRRVEIRTGWALGVEATGKPGLRDAVGAAGQQGSSLSSAPVRITCDFHVPFDWQPLVCVAVRGVPTGGKKERRCVRVSRMRGFQEKT